MANLVPGTQYTIVRQIDNINDPATYYIQAVVRNLNSGVTLATLNLVSKGNQRYTASYQVPADTSGLGTYISITTYVYDDSGHTVHDQNYATEDKEYLIIQPPVSTYGNGGTTIVDYDKIKKFISDIKFPGVPSYDKDFKSLQEYNDKRFSDVKGHIEKSIKGITIPQYDDSGMKQSVASLQNEIHSMRIEHATALKSMANSHSVAIANLTAHYEQTQKMMEMKLSKIADRPYAAERERDSLSKEHENLKKDYGSLVGVIKSVQTNGKYEDSGAKQNTMEARVKKLMGI